VPLRFLYAGYGSADMAGYYTTTCNYMYNMDASAFEAVITYQDYNRYTKSITLA